MSASPDGLGPWQGFPALRAIEGLSHAFVLRHPDIAVDVDRSEALANLDIHFERSVIALGFSPQEVATAEQVHGAEIALVEEAGGLRRPIPKVDGLITQRRGLLLGIYVADCCAVYIADRRGRAVALVHSGKKGTEGGIAPAAILRMAELGIPPEDMVVQLSPCIRPPAYEVDFAAQIRSDCQTAGVPEVQIMDEGTCTSSDLERFYSYRVEKGRTGRMLALLGLQPAAGT